MIAKTVASFCVITLVGIGTAGAQQQSAGGSRSIFTPKAVNLYDANGVYLGPLVQENTVVIYSGRSSAGVALLASYLGFWIPRDSSVYKENSLIIFFPKRDCRGEPFIKLDGATTPYLAYPIGLTRSGFGPNYYSKIQYVAPIPSTLGYKYLFSKRNMATNVCEEGTYEGYFMQGEVAQVNFKAPFSVR